MAEQSGNIMEGMKFKPPSEKPYIEAQPERYTYSEPMLKFLIAHSKTPGIHQDWKNYAVYEKEENYRTPADNELVNKLETNFEYMNALNRYNRYVKQIDRENREDIYDIVKKETITIREFKKRYGEVGEVYVREFIDNDGHISRETKGVLHRYYETGITPTMITTNPVSKKLDKDMKRAVRAEVQRIQDEITPEDFFDSSSGQASEVLADNKNMIKDNEESLFAPEPKVQSNVKGYSPIENKTMDRERYRRDSFSTLSVYHYLRTYVKWTRMSDDKYKMFDRFTAKGKIAVSIGYRELGKAFGRRPGTLKEHIDKMIDLGWIKKGEFGINVGKYKDQNIYFLGRIVNDKYYYFIDEVYKDDEK